MKPAEPCRKYGILEASYSNWKAKFGGMTASEARRLKELEQKNNKLNRLPAESKLDNAELKDLQITKPQSSGPEPLPTKSWELHSSGEPEIDAIAMKFQLATLRNQSIYKTGLMSAPAPSIVDCTPAPTLATDVRESDR